MSESLIYQNMKCPLCDHRGLEARDHENEERRTTFAYICQNCPFVGFEYYIDEDLISLKEILK